MIVPTITPTGVLTNGQMIVGDRTTLTRANLAAQLLVAMISIDWSACNDEDRAIAAFRQADVFFKLLTKRGSDHETDNRF